MADIESNDGTRPKTSATTTSSPRIKESITRSHIGNTTGNINATSGSTGTVNAKKRLAVHVPPQVLRPQTSPDVVTVKNRVAANRTQCRSRNSNSKRKAGNVAQINSNFLTETIQEKSEEKSPKVVQKAGEEHSEADILVVTASGSGFNGAVSEGAWPAASPGRGFGELENVDRLSRAEMQSKEPSPPSRNNRYGSGIKTRLAKLFNKGNTCMEEPKVIEPQRSQGIDHVQTHLSQPINANHGHTRY